MQAAQVDGCGRTMIGWYLDPDRDDLVAPDDFMPDCIPDDPWEPAPSGPEWRTAFDELLAALDEELPTSAGRAASESRSADRVAGSLLDGAGGAAAADVIGLLDERQLSGPSLMGAILACDRLASWVSARQQEFTAALARPGVGIPVEQALEASMYGAGSHELSVSPTHPLQPDWDDDAGCYSAAKVIGDPDWDAAMAVQSARLVAPHLAVALHLSPLSARQRIDDALQMVDQFPSVLGAQRSGTIDRIRARIIAESTECLDVERRAKVLDRVLPGAGTMAPGRLRAAVDRAVISADPESAKKRAEQAHHNRQVRLQKLSGNMSRLAADLSADKAHLVFGVIDRIACSLTDETAAGRGIGELRADVLADIFDQLAATGLVDLTEVGEGEGAIGPDEGVGSGGSSWPGDSNEPDTASEPDHLTRPTEPDQNGPCAGPNHTADPGVPSEPAAATEPGVAPDPPTTCGSDPTPEPAACEPNPAGTPAAAADDDSADVAARRSARNTFRSEQARRRARRTFRGSLCLNVTIAASTLAGFDDEPGELAGHGAITADLARALAKSADSVRALVFQPGCDLRRWPSDTSSLSRADLGSGPPGSGPPGPGDSGSGPPGPDDSGSGPPGPDDSGSRAPSFGDPRWVGSNPPEHAGEIGCTHPTCTGSRYCGTSLDYGRAVYLPPAPVADAVVSRDRRCRFPGCGMPAHRCDIDHRVPFDSASPDGGNTCPCNLQSLCRSHHRCKTFTEWTIDPQPDGSIRWTSTLGPSAVDRPEPPPLGTPWLAGSGPGNVGGERACSSPGNVGGERGATGNLASASKLNRGAAGTPPQGTTAAHSGAPTWFASVDESTPGDDPPF